MGEKKKKGLFFLVVGSVPVEGVGLVSCDVSLVGGACVCVKVDRACLFEVQCSVQ